MNIRALITRFFFPLRCPLCGEIIPLCKDSCSCCNESVTLISERFCRHCGAEEENCTCNEYGGSVLENLAGVYIYSGKIRSQIALFKFAGVTGFAKEFSLRMSERAAQAFSEATFDAVTYVPSSEKSIKARGFNQSELLAKGVAERLFLPLSDFLVKVKETELQHSLSAKERTENLDGAFALKNGADVKGKTVLLCDDIKTTGTTLRKCADVLYEGGAKEVYCIVLAVTDYLTDF